MKQNQCSRRAAADRTSLLKLAIWLIISLVVVAFVSRGQLSADPGLFQSDVSPTPEPDTPTPTATLEATTEPTVEATATTPAEPPTATQPVVPTQPPAASATTAPTVAPQPSNTSPPAFTATQMPPSATSQPSTVVGPTAQVPADAQRYSGDESDVSFDWGMLFDTVALGVSYVWLCCGILLLLAIPLVFVVLWVASRRRV